MIMSLIASVLVTVFSYSPCDYFILVPWVEDYDWTQWDWDENWPPQNCPGMPPMTVILPPPDLTYLPCQGFNLTDEQCDCFKNAVDDLTRERIKAYTTARDRVISCGCDFNCILDIYDSYFKKLDELDDAFLIICIECGTVEF